MPNGPCPPDGPSLPGNPYLTSGPCPTSRRTALSLLAGTGAAPGSPPAT